MCFALLATCQEGVYGASFSFSVQLHLLCSCHILPAFCSQDEVVLSVDNLHLGMTLWWESRLTVGGAPAVLFCELLTVTVADAFCSPSTSSASG